MRVAIVLLSIGLSEFLTYIIDPPPFLDGVYRLVHWEDLVALDGDISEQMLVEGVQPCLIEPNDVKVFYFCEWAISSSIFGGNYWWHHYTTSSGVVITPLLRYSTIHHCCWWFSLVIHHCTIYTAPIHHCTTAAVLQYTTAAVLHYGYDLASARAILQMMVCGARVWHCKTKLKK